MQAIILAAGMGKRLKQLTQNNTKCMVKVNGVPLINRALGQLDQLGLSRIILVVGYEREKLIRHIDGLDVSTPIEYVENPIYDKTNNIYSLFLARKYLLEEDTLLLESDIIFDDSVLRCLVEDSRDSLALAAKYESWMDGTCLLLSEQDDIEAMIPGSKFRFSDMGNYYKTVNLYKFSRDFSRTHYVPFLEAYTAALGNNEYYEQVLKVLVSLDNPGIKAKRLTDDQLWYEIDDIQDLDIAESLFAPEKEKTALIHRRFGGYWRYPKMLDFCYLVNCYYPPRKMLDEIKAKGKKAALSIKPKTPASVLLPYLDKLDMVLVMTVEPGFGGQSFMADMMPKVRGIRALLNEYKPDCEVEVDGGIDEGTAPLVVDAGANVLVAGSAVFGKPDRAKAIEGIRMAAAVKP